MQKAYEFLGYKSDDFPVTNTLCKEVLSLPICPEMEKEQIDYITDNVIKFFDK